MKSSKLDALAARYGMVRRVEDDAHLRQRIEHAVTGMRADTLDSVDAAVSDTLEWCRPAHVDAARLKVSIALRWLGKPAGFWRGLAWALKLAWRQR
jgi:hypothetical protein